jgi:hypothetical protein
MAFNLQVFNSHSIQVDLRFNLVEDMLIIVVLNDNLLFSYFNYYKQQIIANLQMNNYLNKNFLHFIIN